MHPEDLPKVRESLKETLISHLIAINGAKLTKEDVSVIMEFPLGLLIEKDSGFIVNGIESIINDELKKYGLRLKRYSVYALASGNFNLSGDFSSEDSRKLMDITERLVGEDPTKEDVITVGHAIDAMMVCIIPIGKAA